MVFATQRRQCLRNFTVCSISQEVEYTSWTTLLSLSISVSISISISNSTSITTSTSTSTHRLMKTVLEHLSRDKIGLRREHRHGHLGRLQKVPGR